MNRIILTGTILDYPDRKGLCLKYSFRPDGMEESIILAIKCQSEEAKETAERKAVFQSFYAADKSLKYLK